MAIILRQVVNLWQELSSKVPSFGCETIEMIVSKEL